VVTWWFSLEIIKDNSFLVSVKFFTTPVPQTGIFLKLACLNFKVKL